MNILTKWLRHYLPTLTATDRQLADDLTLRGIAVEGVHDLGHGSDGKPNGHLFEMDITTNRVDAMNHYGIAREAATIYNLPLVPLTKDVSSGKDALGKNASSGENALTKNASSGENALAKDASSGKDALGKDASSGKDVLGKDASSGEDAHGKDASSGKDALGKDASSRPEPKAEWRDPRISPEAPHSSAPPAFPIHIEAKDLCGRFTAQILRNITIAPSTGQIAEYFALLNQKQISNAVDASNFTLLGMGHPTHAFDLDKLEGGIIVRLAHKGERLKLLDGSEHILEPDDLVVADHKKALALAGVMGGYDSMITAETKNILVESAWFSPAAVRRSSRRHGLHTDASHRFERGADINAAPIANALVSKLILEHGGQAEGQLIDILIPEIAAKTANRPPIQLSAHQVQRHLGTTLDDKPGESALTPTLIHQYLTALGCELSPTENAGELKQSETVRVPHPSQSHREGWDVKRPNQQDTTFQVQLPSWRLDLEREIDLIEEVARVYGYNRFANTLPTPLPVTSHPTSAKEDAIRTRLLALGYSEAISSTFASQQTPKSSSQPPPRVAHPLRFHRNEWVFREANRLPPDRRPSSSKTLSPKKSPSSAHPSSPAWPPCSRTTSTAT